MRFCRACGHVLSDPASAAAALAAAVPGQGPKPVAERRVCSVVFCDRVSADPLSSERGSYQFAQQMLRQVADTLSRRDRKSTSAQSRTA
jgi:hypothetical protein